ncbi:MAG: glycosyltransferase family 4 protein [Patescibacteria group bacterium]
MPRTSKISVFEIIADSSLTGAPRHLLALLSHIDRSQFVVSVILPEGDLVDELKKLKVPVFTVPMQGMTDLSASSAIHKLLQKYEPDIVHTHGQRAGLLGRVASRGLSLINIHTEHTYTDNFKLNNPVLHWTHLRAMKVLDRLTNHTIAVSDSVRTFLVSSGITKPDKVSIIHNGIDSLKSKPSEVAIKKYRASLDVSPRDLLVGTIGSLNKQKDTDVLIKAFANMHTKWPNTKLLIIGKGERLRELQNLVKKLDIKDSVRFAGALADVNTALFSMDLFILPSRSEAFGISILEAMRAQVPIIASRVGGIPEIITDNYNGLLFESGNVKNLSATMLKLLNDKKLQKKIVSHYAETLRKFSAKNMAKEVEEIYRHSLGRS